MEAKIGKVSDFSEGMGRLFSVDGRQIAVFKVGEGFFAIDELCPHRQGPLHEGEVNGTFVTCPLHGSEFDLKTGRVVRGPAASGVRSYRIAVKGDEVFVSTD